jgi:hypothetical protein
MVVAFVGKPHRIDNRTNQVLKSLRAIGFDQYYQAEQTGWVLYLEGSTDLAVLQGFAELLDHPAKGLLERPFVHYVANQPSKARDHFFGLREAKPDLVGAAIFDSIAHELSDSGPLFQVKWRRREIENYLCNPQTLLAYSEHIEGDPGELFEGALRDNQRVAMQKAIAEVSAALKVLGRPDPFGPEVKASDDFLGPLFQSYFEKLGLRNLMQKTNYHVLTKFVPRECTDPEIVEKLDLIVMVAGQARPLA